MLPISEVALKSVYKIPNQCHAGESPGFEVKPNGKSHLGSDSSEILSPHFLPLP